MNGAVPLLDGRPSDYTWAEHYFGRSPPGGGVRGEGGSGDCDRGGEGDGGSKAARRSPSPFAAPLGIVFTAETEDSATRAALDGAGFEQNRYALHRRGFGLATAAAGPASGPVPWEAPWRAVLARAKAMGDEEVALRRDINARYYAAALTEARHAVQDALFA